MRKGTKLRTVLVRCLNVDTDGVTPVNRHGQITHNPKSYVYTWETQRRAERWLNEHRSLWKAMETKQVASRQ